MKVKVITLACAFCLLPGLGRAQAAPPASPAAATFEDARLLYAQHRWAGAYGRFAALADRGDARAAHIALFMLRYGPDLYQSAWSATLVQIERWMNLDRSSVATFSADGAD